MARLLHLWPRKRVCSSFWKLCELIAFSRLQLLQSLYRLTCSASAGASFGQNWPLQASLLAILLVQAMEREWLLKASILVYLLMLPLHCPCRLNLTTSFCKLWGFLCIGQPQCQACWPLCHFLWLWFQVPVFDCCLKAWSWLKPLP